MVFESQPEEEVTFIDAENYQSGPQAPLTYEMIVLGHIRKCVNEGSMEMFGGYFKEKNTSRGTIQEYVPDQKQVYMRCIMSLQDVLLPFYDEEMAKDAQEFDAKIKEIDDFIYKAMLTQTQGANINQKRAMEYKINLGYIDNESLEFKYAIDRKLDAYRWLFQRLILLFNRKRYLMAQAIED